MTTSQHNIATLKNDDNADACGEFLVDTSNKETEMKMLYAYRI